VSSLQLTSDPLVTAAAGLTEYNGTALFFTPLGTQRGIVPSEQFFRLNADLAGANATGAQNVFGVGVSLSASTVYEFEIVYALLKSTGTTSHTVSVGFGGTATLNNIAYLIQRSAGTALVSTSNNMSGSLIQTASSTVQSGAVTNATATFIAIINGVVSVNAAGTFIPQYTLSAAPGGAYSTQGGGFMKIKPIGASGANTSVGTWA
jgi:hypothetical protein